MNSLRTKARGAAADVNGRVRRNDASMHNGLLSTAFMKGWDQCCGIHGAARERRGAKKATSAARRRHEKALIRKMLDE